MKKFVVNSKSELIEAPLHVVKTSPTIKATANFLSYIFHPVFVPVYVIYFLLYVSPFLFIGFSPLQKLLMIAHAILMYTFFPIVTVLLLKALNFISSIKLRTQKDRIIPFIASGMWYFWVWYVWRNQAIYPREAVVFAMAVFLASSIGLMFNIYIKISMHGIAIGTAISFLCLLSFNYNTSFGLYLSVAFLIGGMVCTSRLLLLQHSSKEVYLGLGAGLLAVMIANLVM